MATVTGYTAARMKEIEDQAIVNGAVVINDLILTRYNGATINAGNVRGPTGATGPAATLNGYEEQINDMGNVAGTVTIDFNAFNIWRINPTAAVTIAFTNLPPVGYVNPATIIVANSSFGITWPAGTKFPKGTIPVLEGETFLSMLARSTHVTVGVSWPGVA